METYTDNKMNQIIENCEPVYNAVMQFGIIIALHAKTEYINAKVYTFELCEMLEENPFYKTNKYQWETRKVDQLINVTIWQVK